MYAVKVGAFIREFVTGRKDWSKFIDAVTKAFVNEIQNEIYTAFMGASAYIPEASQFNKTGTLSDLTKETFDTLVEDVSIANNNAPVAILGTKAALRKINALSDLTWRPQSDKESVARTGILGDYEGTTLIEIPQRFAYNDLANKLVDNTKIFIMPLVDNKPVKFVDYGETEVIVDKIAEKMDDRQTYEVQRRLGVGVIIDKYYGVWNIA